MNLLNNYLTNIGNVLGINNLSKNCIAVTHASSGKGNLALNGAFELTQTGANSQILLKQIRRIYYINPIHEIFLETNLKILNKILKNTSQDEIIVNVDIEKRPYYGNHKESSIYIHNETNHRGSTGSFFYQGISVRTHYGNVFISLKLLSIFDDPVKDALTVLEFLKEKYNIKLVLFDRGYNSYELVDKLNTLGLNYMIFWRKSGKTWTTIFQELKDSSSCCVRKKVSWCFLGEKHLFDARFVIIKQLQFLDDKKKYDWIFCTNLNLNEIDKYVSFYRKRWGIETAFRVFDGGEIKTTSKDRCIRQMVYYLSALIYNIWILAKSQISKDLTFTNFYEVLLVYLRKIYNIQFLFKNEILELLEKG